MHIGDEDENLVMQRVHIHAPISHCGTGTQQAYMCTSAQGWIQKYCKGESSAGCQDNTCAR